MNIAEAIAALIWEDEHSFMRCHPSDELRANVLAEIRAFVTGENSYPFMMQAIEALVGNFNQAFMDRKWARKDRRKARKAAA